MNSHHIINYIIVGQNELIRFWVHMLCSIGGFGDIAFLGKHCFDVCVFLFCTLFQL